AYRALAVAPDHASANRESSREHASRGGMMAFGLKPPKLFAAYARSDATADLDMPSTVRRDPSPQAYDTFGAGIDDERLPVPQTRMPRQVPFVGHLLIVRQFWILGVMLVMFLVFAAVIMFLDVKSASQVAASSATAVEMQMLSQRIARGAALASQGQTARFT